jgi:hypothetical protein
MTYSLGQGTSVHFLYEFSSWTAAYMTNVLRYEDSSMYSLVVTAADDGTPPQTGTALISVSVVDVNDNSPVFSSVPSDISIEDKNAAWICDSGDKL